MTTPRLGPVTRALHLAVCSPNENLDLTGYRSGVLESFRRIQGVQETIAAEQREPRADEVQLVIEALRTLLTEKKMDPREIDDCLAEILDHVGGLR